MPFAYAAGATALGSIATSVIGANAATSAAKTEAAAANKASDIEQAQFNTTNSELAPYRQAGTNALTTLQQALGIGGGSGSTGFNTSSFTGSPGYNFQLGQGTNAVQNAASATGGLNSGTTLKALASYGQGLAAQNWQQYLGNLSNLVNTGQSSTVQTGQFGANTASQVASNTIGAGNATAAGTVGAANATNQGISSTIQNLFAYNGQNGAANSNSAQNNPNTSLYYVPTGTGGYGSPATSIGYGQVPGQ